MSLLDYSTDPAQNAFVAGDIAVPDHPPHDKSYPMSIRQIMADIAAGSNFINVKIFGAKGDGATDDTAAINAAIAYGLANHAAGFTLYFPEGRFMVTEIDLTDNGLSPAGGNFEQGIRLMGAGRFATKISPYSTGTVLLNMTGRNNATVQDLSFYADNLTAQTAVFMCRAVASPNCNNNKFLNVFAFGSYSKAAWVLVGAESSSWTNCRYWNTNTTTKNWSFFGGWTNADIGITPVNGGTLTTGPATDNRMIACEAYGNYNNAELWNFSGTCGFTMVGCTSVGGTSTGVKLVNYINLIGAVAGVGGVFNGPVSWLSPHHEVFGVDNRVYWLGGTGTRYFQGLRSEGGYFVTDDNVTGLDFDRTDVTNAPILQGGYFSAPMIAALSVGPSLYADGFIDTPVNWHLFGAIGNVAAFQFAVNSPIAAADIALAVLQGSPATVYAPALPTTGTYAIGQVIENMGSAVGQPIQWRTTVAGTLGLLNGGATTATTAAGSNAITVNSNADMKAGQKIDIATATGGPYYIRKISGTTIYLNRNVTNAVVAQPVSFVGATLRSIGNLP